MTTLAADGSIAAVSTACGKRLDVSRDVLARIAQRHHEIANELDRYIRGELDWVVAASGGETRLVRKRR